MFEYRGKSLRIALLVGLLGTLSATSAQADPSQCMNAPAIVPGLTGAPEWQDFNADGFWRPQLDDPRWAGGPLQYLSSLPVGGKPAWAQAVSMRAVTVGKIVYVSIQAQADDNGPDINDSVYVAFSLGQAATAYALAINLIGGGAVINPPANPAAGIVVPADSPLPTQLTQTAVSYFQATNAETDPAHPAVEPVWGPENDGIPSWLKGARWDRPANGGPRWAITLQIDLSLTGLNIDGPTRFFFGATVHTTGGDVIVGNTTPKVDPDTDRLAGTPIPKRSDLWAQYDNLGTACTGISVDPNDIGVWSGAPGVNGGGSLTNQICTGSGCTATENTFRVTVRHVPNNLGFGAWDLRVRLRVAGWGSQAAYQDDAPWQDIATTPTGTPILLGPAAQFTSQNGWYWASPVDEGGGTSALTVDYKCTKGTANYCPTLADMSERHQAVFVELAAPGPLWPFASAGAYRNMDLTVAAGGTESGGAGGTADGGTGGTAAGGASGGEAGTGEAGETSGGRSSVSGAPGMPAAGASAGASSAQGDAGQADAGATTTPTSPDKGSSCGCRVAGRQSSNVGSLAALLALAVALRRRSQTRE